MSRRLPKLSGTDLDILRVLWAEGALSAREVHARLGGGGARAYSTTRTLLERMVAKGLVGRASFHGIHVYEARLSKPVALAGRVREFARRVLELDDVPVAALFARSDALTHEELAELKRLLAEQDPE